MELNYEIGDITLFRPEHLGRFEKGWRKRVTFASRNDRREPITAPFVDKAVFIRSGSAARIASAAASWPGW
jgi:hypothetical protein